MITGTPANSSISRSLRLSPIAMICAGAMPSSAPATPGAAFLAVGAVTSTREKSLPLVFGAADHLGPARERPCEHPHGLHVAVEHHLDGILGQRGFERRGVADPVPAPLPIAAPVRVVPVHALGDDMTFGLAVEQEHGGVAEGAGLFEHLPRGLPCQQATRQRVAIQRPLDGPIRDDQGDRLGQRLDDRAGERKAATGDQDTCTPASSAASTAAILSSEIRPRLSISVPSMSMAIRRTSIPSCYRPPDPQSLIPAP